MEGPLSGADGRSPSKHRNRKSPNHQRECPSTDGAIGEEGLSFAKTSSGSFTTADLSREAREREEGLDRGGKWGSRSAGRGELVRRAQAARRT